MCVCVCVVERESVQKCALPEVSEARCTSPPQPVSSFIFRTNKILKNISTIRFSPSFFFLLLKRGKSSYIKDTICCFEAEPQSHKRLRWQQENYHNHHFFYRRSFSFLPPVSFFSGLILFWFHFDVTPQSPLVSTRVHPVHLFVCLSVCVCVNWGLKEEKLFFCHLIVWNSPPKMFFFFTSDILDK